jgi:hypothetical protein
VSEPNIAWLLGDLERLFAFHRPVNGVPNFLASMCLLTALEFVARFHMHPTLAEVALAGKRVNELAEDDLRKFRNGRRGAGGRYDTDAALSFIYAFFPNHYKERFPGCRAATTTRARALWLAFRHGHVHGYVPKADASSAWFTSYRTGQLEPAWALGSLSRSYAWIRVSALSAAPSQ